MKIRLFEKVEVPEVNVKAIEDHGIEIDTDDLELEGLYGYLVEVEDEDSGEEGLVIYIPGMSYGGVKKESK